MVNLQEGMRRAALLVGILGASFGCFVSYVTLRDALDRQTQHNAFELLTKSDVVRQERLSLVLAEETPAKEEIEKLRTLNEDRQRQVLSTLTLGARERILIRLILDRVAVAENVKANAWDAFYASNTQEDFKRRFDRINLPSETKAELWKVKLRSGNDPYAAIAEDPFADIAEGDGLEAPSREIAKNRSGIKKIHWRRDCEVESIERDDGTILYPVAPPTLSRYLLVAIFPPGGFFFPWGFVRIFSWVMAGFSPESSK